MSGVVVLKFGGSFLRGPADLVRAVHTIYAHVREGERVVAVTSAFHGRTDALETSLDSIEIPSTRDHASLRRTRAALLATGEAETASLLVAALERSGVPARLADVRRVGPFVAAPGGSEQPEDPTRLDRAELEALLDEAPVVVLPGFVAAEDTPERAPALLGRGGSDLTAVFVAHGLGAPCTLVKDVDGLYTSDPATRAAGRSAPRRMSRTSFRDAQGLGGAILQPRALRFAEEHGQEVEVVGPRHVAGVRGTRVGLFPTIEGPEALLPRPLRVALLGLGTVGARVFAELQARPDLFEVTHVLVRDLERKDRPRAAGPLLTDDWSEVLDGRPDIVVELTGGAEPAASWMREALLAGVHAVTANKAAFATALPILATAASHAGTSMLGSATVGGALPALAAVRRASRPDADDPIVGFEGVLNGTTNAVLDAVAHGATLDAAVTAAQELGLAEADPRDDLDGTDLVRKLQLLASAAGWTRWGAAPLRWLRRQGIDADSLRSARRATGTQRATGVRLRLVGSVHLSDVGPVASVTLRAVDAASPFHAVAGPENALALEHASGRVDVVRGVGAGAWPTATAVMGDVFAVARRIAAETRSGVDSGEDPSGVQEGEQR
ncbi:MAG: hypothetical protein AAGB93_22125 [Planctomycetota bacterium]